MIQLNAISKSFNDREVLREVSLRVGEGETLAIIGRSGSGKSVLLKHMVGLMQPDSGSVEVDGRDISRIPYREMRAVRQQFGMLFQGGALFDSMDAFENVAFPLRMFTSMTEDAIRARVRECLALVLLSDAGTKRPSELSGGMQKRVALARAIALKPRYLLYDEPTSGLDPDTTRTIDQLIIRMREQLNVTSVVVSHDMHSVLRVADRIAFIHEGVLRWQGTPADLPHATDAVLVDFVTANEYQIRAPLSL